MIDNLDSWIICAGEKRSGSTLQYNIISNIIEIANNGIRIPHFDIDDFDQIKRKYDQIKGHKVIKTHRLTEEFVNVIKDETFIIIHSYRDIRDVVVSQINKGWVSKDLKSILICTNEYLQSYRDFLSLNKGISRKYEEFAFNLKDEIIFLSTFLKIKLTDAQINEINSKLNIKKVSEDQHRIEKDKLETSFNNKFHSDTLFHDNHVFDGSSNQFLKNLSTSYIGAIESVSYPYLLTNNYKLYWWDLGLFLSFSQHADDYIGWQLLNKKINGLVVEVGAFDGWHLSNSFSLEQLGWKSVCIEPNPEIYRYLEMNRPNSTNINCAVVGNENFTEIDFFKEEIGVLSGCNYDEVDIKKRYKNRGLGYRSPEKIKVKAKTLNSIFGNLELAKSEIDILSIDVEGFEMEVLKGLNLEKFKVNLFIIEANTDKEKKSILDYFKLYESYLFIGSNYQNLFFQRKESFCKKKYRNLNFKDYLKAQQHHPIDQNLSIDSVKPNFIKSKEGIKNEKYFGLF